MKYLLLIFLALSVFSAQAKDDFSWAGGGCKEWLEEYGVATLTIITFIQQEGYPISSATAHACLFEDGNCQAGHALIGRSIINITKRRSGNAK